MAQFTARVLETRTVEVLYVVEADTLEDAEGMALGGETEQEVDVKQIRVVSRELITTPAEAQTFQFKNEQAVETQHGTAYFEVPAGSAEEALLLLGHDSSEYHTDFNETDGGLEWEGPFKEL